MDRYIYLCNYYICENVLKINHVLGGYKRIKGLITNNFVNFI